MCLSSLFFVILVYYGVLQVGILKCNVLWVCVCPCCDKFDLVLFPFGFTVVMICCFS